MVMRKAERQLKWNIFLLLLFVGVPVIIAQGIFEQGGVLGCLAPFVGCGALIGLLTLKGFKEDNGDTKVSFEPPVRDEKSHEMAVAMVRQMVGKQIRLVSVHWSDPERDEYLYTPDIEHFDKRRRVSSWMDEPTKDILSKSRYMVESVKGEEDQIRLASVHWSNPERSEYFFSPNADYSLNRKEIREVTSWMGEPTEGVLSTSRYMVEPVPGQEDEIRLISVHWSDPERDEYLYTSRLNSASSKGGREVKSWKVEPTNDILSKSRYRVEFVHSSKEEESEAANWWEDGN
ncbi:MAG: hypothetical protein CMB22_04570 [Euryarchaeota archaeon]|nr:hypothetical protein [Euryarchaeota archaeon]